MEDKNKKKVLIIKLSSLGDVIFSVPLANVLKKNGYEVSWLVSEKGIDIVQGNRCVDKVFLAPFEKWKKSKNIFQNLVEIFNLIKELRKENYDIAIDAQMRIKSLPFLKFCGAKRRIIAKDCKEFSWLGANEFIQHLKEGFDCHVVISYLKFAEYLGCEFSNEDIFATLPNRSEETKNEVDLLLANVDRNKPLIMIAPATTWIGKHWDKDNWRELVRLLEKDFSLIFSGTNKDKELIDYINTNNHLSLAGKTSLNSLIEVLSRIDLLVSLDSGSTHLAWAAQTPKIVSIFCCTPKSLYAPFGEPDKYISIQSNNCSPCHHKKCTNKENAYICTQKPSVNEVYDAIKKLTEREYI